MTNETRQILFKSAAGLAAFAVASAGFDLSGPLASALAGLAGNVASQFGVEACMPFITKKWLSHPDKVVNHHVQHALVTAIHSTLAEIQEEYLSREDVSPHEAASLREFFAVLRDRSEAEYMEATRENLPKQEVLDYVYNSIATTQHLQDRLRINLDPNSDTYYFTERFITYFPAKFTERMQFHFKELLKKGGEAKQAMDLLFFDTLNAGLNTLKTDLQVQLELLNEAQQTAGKTLQQVEFYGEIWLSAIRQNRVVLETIQQKIDELLVITGLTKEDTTATRADVADLKSSFQQLLTNQAAIPGLENAPRFIKLTSNLANAQQEATNARAGLDALNATIAHNPALATDLQIPLDQAQRDQLEKDQKRGDAKQALTTFLNDIAATQRAILETSSHRADKARQLFEQGLFDEANDALDADELRRDQTDLLQQRDMVQQQLTLLAQDFMLKANLVVLTKEPNWFEEARQLYEEAIKSNAGYATYFALAYYLANHNQHQDATLNYEQAFKYADNVVYKSALLNNLGILYSDTGRPAQAEEAYNETLGYYRQLAEQSPATYLPNVATTLNNLGILYSDTGRPAQAEEAYNEALGYYRQLAEQSPATYLPDVATTLNNLGNLYSDTGRPAQAEEAYNETLGYYRQLAEQSPATYLPNVATTLNNLGNLYSDTGRPAQAEEAYNEALGYYRQLAEQSPATYLPNVATTLNNLGILYSDVASTLNLGNFVFGHGATCPGRGSLQ